MPDDQQLYLSQPGTTIVATDAMFADAQALSLLYRGLSGLLPDLQLATHAGEPLDELERASIVAREASEQALWLATKVTIAMQKYSQAEASAEWLAVNGSAVAAFGGGAMLSGWLMLALGPLAGPAALAIPWLARGLTAGDKAVGPDDVTMPDDLNRLLSNPATVAALRLAVSSADEAALGFGGAPALTAALLAGAGITGVSSTAYLLSAYGSVAGLLTETPVTVTRTQTSGAPVTTGFDARFSKVPLPGSTPGGAQIRIDTITTAAAETRFEVYVGGTVDFNPLPADDAFDLTSNVTGVAGLPAGSVRAVQQAMADAGITASSPVTFTGYSQGGMVAAVLTASGDYNVQGVVTVGAPAGNVPLPGDIPAVIVEHVDDFVTALGGVQSNTEALVVQRSAFASAADLPAGLAAPGHRMEYYRETATLMDQARSEQLVEARRQLDAFSAGADSVVSTYYYASRVN
jgi:hypothetical protein